MKRLMTQLSCTLLLCLICSADLFSQIVVVQYRHVPGENQQEFIHRETTYWSEIAQKAVNEGKMLHWELWQKIGGWDLAEGSNYLFVNVFEKPEDLDNMGEVWNASAVFPDMKMADMETNSLGTLNHMLIFQSVTGVGEGQPQYLRVNYAKATNLTKYLELEEKMWLPFIKSQMESGNTTQVSWGAARLLTPAGTSLPFNAVTVDGYQKLSEAVAPGTAFKEAPTFPDFTEINSVHEKDRIQVFGLIKATQPKE